MTGNQNRRSTYMPPVFKHRSPAKSIIFPSPLNRFYHFNGSYLFSLPPSNGTRRYTSRLKLNCSASEESVFQPDL
jgi:hypothetical protein